MSKSLKQLLEETPDFIGKEIWNDGYSEGLKDSDQIRMRDALERIVDQCEHCIYEGQSFINIYHILNIAHEGLEKSHDEPNSRPIVPQKATEAVKPDEVKVS